MVLGIFMNKNSFMFRLLAIACIASSIVGCSVMKTDDSSKMGIPHTPSPGTTTIKFVISRHDFNEAIRHENQNRALRLIQVFASPAAAAVDAPEYRLFGIHPESVYALLGLKNGDVLLAAHGYLVSGPPAFPRYVGLLSTEKASTIEIRRQGIPYLLSFVIQ